MELPELAALRLVVERYAEVLSRLELTPSEQPLVLPNNDWFPDRFGTDSESLGRLVARMQGYAALERANIEARLIGETGGEACGSGGCGTGACGVPKQAADTPRLVSENGAWVLEMPVASMHHPIPLTASVARLLGHVRLLEAGYTETDAVDAELAAMALGFGVFLLEASFMYSKSCGGPSVGSATALSCGELAVPFALFVAFEGHKLRPALAELSTTQRALIDEAWTLVASNRALVERLKDAPERVKSGQYQLKEAGSWLSRLFGAKKSKPKDAELSALEALERGDSLDSVAALLGTDAKHEAPRAVTRARVDDDLRDIVDEALSELRDGERDGGRTAAE